MGAPKPDVVVTSDPCAEDPETSGAAMEMVNEGDAQKAIESMSNPA